METVLVDIDGVLARKHVQRLLALCNDLLQLCIPIKELVAITSLDAFDQLPQVCAHREKVGEERYHDQLEMMRWHPLHVLGCQVIEEAVSGVQYLAQHSSKLQYCTARWIDFSPEWNDEMARSTRGWLKNNAFPNADAIIFCDSVLRKWTTIAAVLRQQPQPIVLIDDSLDLLLDAFEELPKADQRLLRRYLTLVAFSWSKEEFEEAYPVRVLALEDWKGVEQLRKEIEHVR